MVNQAVKYGELTLRELLMLYFKHSRNPNAIFSTKWGKNNLENGAA
jgi:hypothetical protein